MAAQTDIDNQ